ncbi:two-component system, CitB family, sensor histidine kinase CitS [Piscibacillus halophilus]|uniref:histidine kinase n=1 Tax=Piscibacillus halophilus TaxID=571933 RepID=A0A1H9FVD0_9BACI|nr:two-component system, CitB family, sensor histidine kinase CitS [Piscibacillus halophilus]
MLRRLLRVSLQTKITGLVIGITSSLIILLLGVFAYLDIQQIYLNREDLSLQTAKTLSFNPDVQEAIIDRDEDELQLLINQYSGQKEGMFAVIQSKDGRFVYHPNEELIDEYYPFDDGYMAVVFGGYYTMESDEFIGSAIVGKAPVYSNSERIIGVVTVGYLKSEINQAIMNRIKSTLYFSLIIFLLGVLLSYLLARHIRKETFGLEPREIATLYRSQSSILNSISEGVIATDENGYITLVNDTAKKLLNINEPYHLQVIDSLLPEINFQEIKSLYARINNKEIRFNQRVIIINLVPIIENSKLIGTVTTFRDKTQITEMLSTLSEVKEYSDNLRAQTHEFSNKMHVISGLIQLEEYDQVRKMINEEIVDIQNNNKLIFEHIQDPKVQAVLLGKLSKASEKKIKFTVDPNSSLNVLPNYIDISHIITIMGNLIDNAFDAVAHKKQPVVSFFTLDIGQDIILEITDNGDGINEDLDLLFKKGFSTKGTGQRGFGLYNVKESINSLNGSIEVESDDHGTTFSVFIPKLKGGVTKNDKNYSS